MTTDTLNNQLLLSKSEVTTLLTNDKIKLIPNQASTSSVWKDFTVGIHIDKKLEIFGYASCIHCKSIITYK